VAKKVIFTEEEPVDLSGLEEPVEEIDDEEIEKLFSSIPIEVEEVPNRDTKVEVTPLRDFRCSFGGTWYYFTTGKKQKVSVELRDFLLRNKSQPKIKDIW
jgi:hypothetical protein